MSTSRANLIQSAVNFLRDPTVQNAPLQKRVSFLESKGLTSEEIEDALKQAKGGATASQTEGSQAAAVTAAAPPGQQVVHAVPPPVPRMDWRDYFIAAVIIGGVGWAVIAVIKASNFTLSRNTHLSSSSLLIREHISMIPLNCNILFPLFRNT